MSLGGYDHSGPRASVAPAPARHRPGLGAAVVLVVLGVLAIVALAVVAFLVGPAAMPGAAVLALLPLAAVLGVVRWVDRWEPEPCVALAVAFSWGASVAVLVALVVNSSAQAALLALGAPEQQAAAWTASLVAPAVEESIKGVGVLAVFLAWRRYFDGPVDGVVYAATVAAGFAFVENVLYFGTAIGPAPTPEGASQVATVFVLRAVMSPFAHVVFTVCVGLALGLAARSTGGAWLLAFPVGLVAATVLHGLWNGSATLGLAGGFMAVYVGVQVPVFLGVVALVAWLRRREGVVLRRHLGQYADAGWFTPHEVRMLSSLAERRRAQRWAQGRGGPRARRAMRDFQTVATRLGHHRHRVALRRTELGPRRDENAILAEVSRTRQALERALAV